MPLTPLISVSPARPWTVQWVLRGWRIAYESSGTAHWVHGHFYQTLFWVVYSHCFVSHLLWLLKPTFTVHWLLSDILWLYGVRRSGDEVSIGIKSVLKWLAFIQHKDFSQGSTFFTPMISVAPFIMTNPQSCVIITTMRSSREVTCLSSVYGGQSFCRPCRRWFLPICYDNPSGWKCIVGYCRLDHKGSNSGILQIQAMKPLFEEALLRWPWLCCCDIFSLQMQPLNWDT